ncbi:MAG: toprim domain-containing protein, partial [Deltaproteobacteria bacterium]|nr:toprim domain-containing protein [Deltaproteobacteria bacterium]
TPKYLNSPDSDPYRKSSLLYGLFQALPAIRNEKKVLVVEGYMDLIGLWQKEIRNVVATCGTSLTESHARTLKRLSDTVILLFDGDVAGKKSAVRAGGPLYAAGVSPLALFPPKGMDPDDWAKETAAGELAERIGRAGPLMEYIERQAARKYDLSQIAGRLSYLRLMGQYLPWIKEPAELRLYVQRVARAAGLPEETVLEQVKGKGAAGETEAAGFPHRVARGRPEEGLLLRLLSRDPTLVADVMRDGVAGLVEGEEVREALDLLAARAGRGEEAAVADLLDGEISEEARKRLSEEIIRADMPADEARRIYPDVALGLKIRKMDREIATLGDAIKAAE